MRPSKRHRLERKERELRRRPRKRADPFVARRLIEAQNPRLALLAGGVVALAGAMVWMIVSLSTDFLFQSLALAIGAACGFAVGHFGHVVDRRYARISAYCCILSCVCGEFLVAYTLQVEFSLLYTANSLALLIVFVLAGAVTAYLCTFAWLSSDQKRALWNERHKSDEDRARNSAK